MRKFYSLFSVVLFGLFVFSLGMELSKQHYMVQNLILVMQIILLLLTMLFAIRSVHKYWGIYLILSFSFFMNFLFTVFFSLPMDISNKPLVDALLISMLSISLSLIYLRKFGISISNYPEEKKGNLKLVVNNTNKFPKK